MYLLRAIEGRGRTIDFYLSQRRDAGAARRFLAKAVRLCRDWAPSIINTDRNPAYSEAIRKLKAAKVLDDSVDHRQVKYLNNRLETDHGAIKRRIRFHARLQIRQDCLRHTQGHRGDAHGPQVQCILRPPGVAAEAHSFNKLFGFTLDLRRTLFATEPKTRAPDIKRKAIFVIVPLRSR